MRCDLRGAKQRARLAGQSYWYNPVCSCPLTASKLLARVQVCQPGPPGSFLQSLQLTKLSGFLATPCCPLPLRGLFLSQMQDFAFAFVTLHEVSVSSLSK